jgi:hypothetical protein
MKEPIVSRLWGSIIFFILFEQAAVRAVRAGPRLPATAGSSLSRPGARFRSAAFAEFRPVGCQSGSCSPVTPRSSAILSGVRLPVSGSVRNRQPILCIFHATGIYNFSVSCINFIYNFGWPNCKLGIDLD